MNRHFIGCFFFLIAIVLMVITEIYLTLIFKEFILAGKGLSVYGVLLYFVVMIVSSLLWLLSYRISKNRAQAAIFWFVALALTPIAVFQPTWWSASLMN
ncbi:hypothetical protein [Pseudoalteromonas sp. S558]|uniref:hypothetical protein n=1 Tax=Pseudoalteromonas sp. S558 TaxID=2066515 RepID=UPI00110A8C1B|nr:hypothetical protein [Pseudoalteromonas sp. S558]TMN98293.1 hypothetical protein CWB66_16590 [Pseudoalteromonas sp. S558]